MNTIFGLLLFFSHEKITNNNETVNKNINEFYKYDYQDIEKELPLPNINNLRKWIKNEKKAS